MIYIIFYSSLGGLSFTVVDGEPYVKVGADTLRPFKRGTSYAVISSSIVHGSFAYTTGDTNDSEHFQLLYSETKPSGNYNGTNRITIKKECSAKIIFMMVGGSAPDSFLLDIKGESTTYTNTYGVLYEETVSFNVGDTISVIGNGASGAYAGATLLVVLE